MPWILSPRLLGGKNALEEMFPHCLPTGGVIPTPRCILGLCYLTKDRWFTTSQKHQGPTQNVAYRDIMHTEELAWFFILDDRVLDLLYLFWVIWFHCPVVDFDYSYTVYLKFKQSGRTVYGCMPRNPHLVLIGIRCQGFICGAHQGGQILEVLLQPFLLQEKQMIIYEWQLHLLYMICSLILHPWVWRYSL